MDVVPFLRVIPAQVVLKPTTASPDYLQSETSFGLFFSIQDFRHFCRKIGARVLREIPIVGGAPREGAWGANWRASDAVFVIGLPT